MLALAWNWHGNGRERQADLAPRLAASLCSGIGGRAFSDEAGGIEWAYRPIGPTTVWRPALLDAGSTVFFHGYFDNAAEVAGALGTTASEPGVIYGLAIERWGDDADLRVIGDYCAVFADTRHRRLRLARSPLRAPPLVYSQASDRVAAASVPRALFTAGFRRQLNEHRVADCALLNFSDEEASWFTGVQRVPLGHVVELRPGLERRLHRYYDVLDCQPVRMGNDADYIARAGELLDDGVRTALAGSSRPGVALSGGLDSPQVAVRALAALPAGQVLPTFTFHPEDEWDGITTRGGLGDESGYVRAFAAMHPRLEPHFTSNAGYGHDHCWDRMFHLMDGASSVLPSMYLFHGLFAQTRDSGCDLLLLSEWGNRTFSSKGEWGFAEYLVTGQWRQLAMALSRNRHDDRSFLRRFLALSIAPLLPSKAYLALRRAIKPNVELPFERYVPLSKAYRVESGAEERMHRSGHDLDIGHPRNRRHWLELNVRASDAEEAEIYQAFEQLYGVRQRDPTAYRPLAEFCFGLPTRMYMRNGEVRWLAKQLNKGIMPEEQRQNVLNGRWDADWHLRIGRRRSEYLAELDRIGEDSRLARMLDLPRVRAALADFPAETPTDSRMWTLECALPRLLLTARFVHWAEGKNA